MHAAADEVPGVELVTEKLGRETKFM